MEITIKRLDKPFNTPLVPLIMQAVHELTSQSMHSTGDPGWDCKVLYAERDGVSVGFIC